MGIDAGRLRHRVAIQEITYTQDPDTGENVESWSNIAGMDSVPAAIEPLSVREFLQSSAEQNQVSARITIRYRPNLPVRFRVLHKSTIYNPQGVLPDKDSGLEYFTLACSSGVNAG